MRFPKSLYQNGRETLGEEKILPITYMFARHKPRVDWVIGEDFPDFTKLKSDQSFNWSPFSLPIWARFNNQKVYFKDYGVMGYSVKKIKNAHLIDNNIPADIFRIHHQPDPNNYSHCELYQTNRPTTKEKRAWRMMLVHNGKTHILPERRCYWVKILIDYSIMWYHCLLVKRKISAK